MITPGPGPHLYGLPPGADFPRALAEGLRGRLAGARPEAVARVEIIVNARRTAARLLPALARAFGPDALLPAVRVVGGLADHPDAPVPGPPVDPLRRLLDLSELVRALLRRRGDLAPESARFELAAALAGLLDELQGAGIDPAALASLDVGDHARHWETSLAFLRIVTEAWPAILVEAGGAAADPEARLRAAIEGLAARWRTAPPDHPVILAGSTGSRPGTALLMQAVAALPAGAVVLPGFDANLPPAAWSALTPEHPQAAIGAVLAGLGAGPGDVRPWADAAEPCAARNRLVSVALRPPPATDAWLAEVPGLRPALAAATEGLTLIEAESQREEALAVALRLRAGVEGGGAAALVTPDRALARRVTAELARWDLRPDDSAGRPLALTPPGLFLRLLLRLDAAAPQADRLVALLKHPLAGGEGAARGAHMLAVARLEQHLREAGLPTAPRAALGPWAAAFDRLLPASEQPLAERVAGLAAAAEALAGGPRLWGRSDGRAARGLLDRIAAAAAGRGPLLDAPAFARLLDSLLAAENVPPADPDSAPDPRLRILGNREARIETAPLVILGGLNEGVWPGLPAADPWLSRPMRAALGLGPPERQVGLAAHDFATAAGAAEVVLTRAKRADGAPTLASRWLLRLVNLLGGCGAEGQAALAAMQARGTAWLRLARALDRPEAPVPPEGRPAPRPPVAVRPRSLSATRVETLIRDPYAIYAERILRLKPLEPLGRLPDARDRGMLVHAILKRFVEGLPPGPALPADARDRLLAIAEAEIASAVPWAAERRLWRGRLARAADWFLAGEAERRAGGEVAATEIRGRLELALPAGPFALTARADRIDRLADGSLAIIDYKTGSPPSVKQEAAFARQLWIEAAMAEAGGFEGIAPARVAAMLYLGLTGSGDGGVAREIRPEPAAVAGNHARMIRLLGRFDDPATPYPSRTRVALARAPGDYDHLARVGEWEPGEEDEP
jgi:inactivated superfamily I helicase/RecB family exonuclease